jgi:hypothetical protein
MSPVQKFLFDVWVRHKVYGGRKHVAPSDIEPDKRKQKKAMRELVAAGYLDTFDDGCFDATSKAYDEWPREDFDLIAMWDAVGNKRWCERESRFMKFILFQDLTRGQQKATMIVPGVRFRLCQRGPLYYHTLFDPSAHLSDPVAPGPDVAKMKKWMYDRPEFKDRRMSDDYELVVETDELIAHANAAIEKDRFDKLFVRNLAWGLVKCEVATSEEAELIKPQASGFMSERSEGYLGTDPLKWGDELHEAIVDCREKIDALQRNLIAMSAIEARVHAFGGWDVFREAMANSLRKELAKKKEVAE